MIRSKTPLIRALRLSSAVAVLMIASGTMAQTTGRAGCSSPEYHQFDFWIGDWEVTDVADPKTLSARVRVERILNGCVLKETYEGVSGLSGQSFSIFDRSRELWHQTWVTDHGQLLMVEGRLSNGEMVLKGEDKTADGKDRLVRGIWIPEKNGVRETAMRSTDGGKTWQPWFDLNFRPAVRAR